jgi:PAS domain S-box-containing protein
MRDESDQRIRHEAGSGDVTSRFRALVEQSPLGISISRDGITLYTNPSCARLFGYDSPEELIGTSQLNRVAPENREQVLDYIKRRKRGEAAPAAYEIRGLRKDGSTFPLYVEVNQIDWDGGPISMAYFQDFTARKELEEAIRKAYDEMVTRVRERTEELASINQRLLNDIAERLRVEEALRQREQELELRSTKLEEMKVTLRTILEHRDQDRKILEHRVSANVNDLIRPLLEKLAQCRTDAQRASCLEVIESNLNEIASPFTSNLTGASAQLTQTELRIASCIRQGMRSKEIASLLRLSKGTIDFHRNNIRRKLGITRSKTSLRDHIVQMTANT